MMMIAIHILLACLSSTTGCALLLVVFGYCDDVNYFLHFVNIARVDMFRNDGPLAAAFAYRYMEKQQIISVSAAQRSVLVKSFS